MTEAETGTGLRLAAAVHPATGARVSIFARWEYAVEHVRDHVLSRPESEAWRLVAPVLEGLFAFEDDDRRWELVRAAQSDAGASLQPVYDEYAGAIGAAAGDARTLGWHVSDRRTTVAIGTSGVLTLFEPYIRSAFLPGQGDPGRVEAAKGVAPTSAQMPRHRPMLPGGAAARRSEPAPNEPAPIDRERAWSHAAKLYYRVFKPAVQHVRSRYHRASDMRGRIQRCDYALLKDVLPRRSRLGFDRWCELRRTCGHDE